MSATTLPAVDPAKQAAENAYIDEVFSNPEIRDSEPQRQ
jgi:hypothetical protein